MENEISSFVADIVLNHMKEDQTITSVFCQKRIQCLEMQKSAQRQ